MYFSCCGILEWFRSARCTNNEFNSKKKKKTHTSTYLLPCTRTQKGIWLFTWPQVHCSVNVRHIFPPPCPSLQLLSTHQNPREAPGATSAYTHKLVETQWERNTHCWLTDLWSYTDMAPCSPDLFLFFFVCLFALGKHLPLITSSYYLCDTEAVNTTLYLLWTWHCTELGRAQDTHTSEMNV